jgi:hypothetical protein
VAIPMIAAIMSAAMILDGMDIGFLGSLIAARSVARYFQQA